MNKQVHRANRCFKNWIRFKNFCYFIANITGDYEENNKLCIKLNASLTSIASNEENDFLISILDAGKSYWLSEKKTINNSDLSNGDTDRKAYKKKQCLSLNVKSRKLQFNNCDRKFEQLCQKMMPDASDKNKSRTTKQLFSLFQRNSSFPIGSSVINSNNFINPLSSGQSSTSETNKIVNDLNKIVTNFSDAATDNKTNLSIMIKNNIQNNVTRLFGNNFDKVFHDAIESVESLENKIPGFESNNNSTNGSSISDFLPLKDPNSILPPNPQDAISGMIDKVLNGSLKLIEENLNNFVKNGLKLMEESANKIFTSGLKVIQDNANKVLNGGVKVLEESSKSVVSSGLRTIEENTGKIWDKSFDVLDKSTSKIIDQVKDNIIGRFTGYIYPILVLFYSAF
ncbi:hypothetical protein B4U79_18059 [Dinothrombium tinctorium]|uniref:C-type lectin domain-containing protein n=1 Tax=Dinothrombium tinctorium TaxID=1965070 RepID=A0A3S3NEW2_9ACAR|nr:hypothetical protein B4U79_18580 [Dinothrombium tinctorium]RWS08413.1 hypothetical protein B4U79_18162 [Dinothrombium tinctorium]RWS10952.1 hypothetical protein B4U79_18059 [Dinothrombium tinctorium]